MKNSSEVCVPVAALALPSEQEGQNTAPSPGDTVDISGTGKVTRVEGDKAYVALETVNGQPVETDAAAPKSLDDEEDELRRAAGKSGPQVY